MAGQAGVGINGEAGGAGAEQGGTGFDIDFDVDIDPNDQGPEQSADADGGDGEGLGNEDDDGRSDRELDDEPAEGQPARRQRGEVRIPADLEARLAGADATSRRLATLEAEFSRRQLEARPKPQPPFTLEHLNSGNATPAELIAYSQWQSEQLLNDRMGALANLATTEARSASSASEARGKFSKEAVGEGGEFDTIVGTHVTPLYEQHPQLRQLVHSIDPSNPAVSEYFYGLMLHVARQAKSDPVRTAKAILNSLGAMKRGAKDQRDKINASAKRGADSIAHERRSPRSRQLSIRTGQDVDDLDDGSFRALQRRMGWDG